MDAFSQNPKSISSSETDIEGSGSGTEGLKSHMVIVARVASLREAPLFLSSIVGLKVCVCVWGGGVVHDCTLHTFK